MKHLSVAALLGVGTVLLCVGTSLPVATLTTALPSGGAVVTIVVSLWTGCNEVAGDGASSTCITDVTRCDGFSQVIVVTRGFALVSCATAVFVALVALLRLYMPRFLSSQDDDVDRERTWGSGEVGDGAGTTTADPPLPLRLRLFRNGAIALAFTGAVVWALTIFLWAGSFCGPSLQAREYSAGASAPCFAAGWAVFVAGVVVDRCCCGGSGVAARSVAASHRGGVPGAGVEASGTFFAGDGRRRRRSSQLENDGEDVSNRRDHDATDASLVDNEHGPHDGTAAPSF